MKKIFLAIIFAVYANPAQAFMEDSLQISLETMKEQGANIVPLHKWIESNPPCSRYLVKEVLISVHVVANFGLILCKNGSVGQAFAAANCADFVIRTSLKYLDNQDNLEVQASLIKDNEERYQECKRLGDDLRAAFAEIDKK